MIPLQLFRIGARPILDSDITVLKLLSCEVGTDQKVVLFENACLNSHSEVPCTVMAVRFERYEVGRVIVNLLRVQSVALIYTIA